MKAFNLIIPLFLVCQMAFANPTEDSARIKKASEFLTPKVLMKMFKGENLDKAYSLAQEEDFTPGEPVLITSKMEKYLSASLDNWYNKFAKYPGFKDLKFIPTRSEDERMNLLQIWRYEYLMRLMDAIRYRNSLKPTLKLSVSSITQYDSNVDTAPEQANSGAAISSSGKDDFQQLFLIHADWEPLANCKKFPKDLKYSQAFNAITISQGAHKENEVAIFDTEPKLIKTFDSYFQKLTLGYRFQHFAYSGYEHTRKVSSLFQDHRIKVQMDTKTVPFFFENIFDLVQSGWYVSFSDKQYYKTAFEILDASDMRIGLLTNFTYKSGKRYNRLRTLLEYSDYVVDDTVTSEYKYLRARLTHYHSAKFSSIPNTLNLSEEIGYRIKSWDDFDGTRANRDEDTYYINLKVATNLTEKSEVSFNIKQLFRQRDEQNLGTEEADQTIIGLGLNWRTH